MSRSGAQRRSSLTLFSLPPGFSAGDELVISFDEPFWSPETQFFGVATGDIDSSREVSWWISRLRDSGQAIIKTYCGGPFKTDEELLELGNYIRLIPPISGSTFLLFLK